MYFMFEAYYLSLNTVYFGVLYDFVIHIYYGISMFTFLSPFLLLSFSFISSVSLSITIRENQKSVYSSSGVPESDQLLSFLSLSLYCSLFHCNTSIHLRALFRIIGNLTSEFNCIRGLKGFSSIRFVCDITFLLHLPWFCYCVRCSQNSTLSRSCFCSHCHSAFTMPLLSRVTL